MHGEPGGVWRAVRCTWGCGIRAGVWAGIWGARGAVGCTHDRGVRVVQRVRAGAQLHPGKGCALLRTTTSDVPAWPHPWGPSGPRSWPRPCCCGPFPRPSRMRLLQPWILGGLTLCSRRSSTVRLQISVQAGPAGAAQSFLGSAEGLGQGPGAVPRARGSSRSRSAEGADLGLCRAARS